MGVGGLDKGTGKRCLEEVGCGGVCCGFHGKRRPMVGLGCVSMVYCGWCCLIISICYVPMNSQQLLKACGVASPRVQCPTPVSKESQLPKPKSRWCHYVVPMRDRMLMLENAITPSEGVSKG